MRKSKYLILSSLFIKFDIYQFTIVIAKPLLKNINILDLSRFNKIDTLKLDECDYSKNLKYIFLSNEAYTLCILKSQSVSSKYLYINLANLSNLKVIYPYSFFNSNLKYLDLSHCKSMVQICDYTFKFNKISRIRLPLSIEYIGIESFCDNNIYNLDLFNYEKIKTILNYAFSTCKIKNLKLPKNIESINSFVFYNNDIEYLNLCDYISLNRIGENAFSNNPLKEIKLLNNIIINHSEFLNYQYDRWNLFAEYYNKTDKHAGDYKYEEDKWRWYPL